MAVEDVDVVEPEAREALVDAARDAGGAEVEAVLVAAALGGDHEGVARDGRVAEAIPKHRLRHRAAVVPASERGREERRARARGQPLTLSLAMLR